MSGIEIISIEIGHPGGFGGHEFEYQPSDDLFRCVRCGGYEIVLRDRETGQISPCRVGDAGPSAAGGVR